MRIPFAAVAGLAVLAFSVAPGGAAPTPAPAPAGPIRIDATEISPVINGGADPQSSGWVTIAFTNLRASAATEVQFAIEGPDNQPKLLITDKGNFGKGIRVQHVFRMLSDDRHLHVIVVEASFADGNTWTDDAND